MLIKSTINLCLYPLKGDRLQVSEVVYSVVSFYKEVTGHSFSYYLCKF